ncbi:MAG: heparinase II/III family protein [Sedimentisphaerales bacterium]|nr:heparinase II/III family protein [Sedimentisphaerales bacterium]
MRKRIDNEAIFKEAWNKLLRRADRLLEQELVSKEYAEGGSGQHGNYKRPSSQISDMGETLGLAYQMTGEKHYAEKLRDALIHYGSLSRWAGDAHHNPPWHSELNTARFCYGYAVGYDSIYDYLSDDERKTIAEAMIRLGILPTLDDWVLGDKRIHALDSMGHNWWSVCVSMAGLASLSLLGDEPQAEFWNQRVSEAFPEWFTYQGNVLQNKTANFDSQGAFYESVSYANYALSEYLLFRLAYTNVFGTSSAPDIPLLKTAGDFFIHTCYPTSNGIMSVNFGDSNLNATGARTLQILLANGYDKPQYHWYLNRTDPGLDDPVGLVYYELNPQKSPINHVTESMLYPDIGWAILRSSWEDDATMLAVKSGFAWNHAHPDAGSFILFHKGKPLIIDSGNCSYSRREYTTYYRHSKAHNVILIDGQGQNPEDCGNGDRGTVTPGRIHRLIDTVGLKYVFADATGPMSWKFSHNYRHFLWVGDVILIFDDVRTHEEGKLEWLLHYQNNFERQGRQILISNGNARVIVQPVFPEEITVTEKKGLKDHDPDTEVTYLAFSPKETTRQNKFITAVLPCGSDGQKPAVQIERLQDNDAIGVRLKEAETVTDIYLNLQADGRKMHRNSCNAIDGWETDAYLFAVTRPNGSRTDDPDSVVRYFVACGSYLRKNGKVVLDSLSKVYTVFAPGKKTEVHLEGQPITTARLRSVTKPDIVVLNGESVDTDYDETMYCIRVGINGLK